MHNLIKHFIRLLSRISSTFNLNVLWRICRCLPKSDRMLLVLRLIQNNVEQISVRMDGALITAYGWDLSITHPLLSKGHYQGNEIKSVISWMKHHNRFNLKKHVIVDVGANIGTSSIPFVQNTDCHVLAIEPFPENFELLLKNVSQNKLKDRITCVQKAVFSRQNIVHMILPQGESGGAMIQQTHLNPSPDDLDIQLIADVPSDGLSNIIKSVGLSPEQIAFVWSDSEGSEPHVVETGNPLWAAGVPLYLEIYPEALGRQCDMREFIKLLVKFFDSFIHSELLIEQGIKAPSVPILEISALIDHLRQKKNKTDVLLLPCNHRFHLK